MTERPHIEAVCISERTGTPKSPVDSGRLVPDEGLDGDAHAGTPNRQVSLLCRASMEKMEELDAEPGDFAENLTLNGCTHDRFAPGATLRLQRGPVLEVTQIGKECHEGCEIARQTGDCIMPREGIFARVVRGGPVKPGDTVEIHSHED